MKICWNLECIPSGSKKISKSSFKIKVCTKIFKKLKSSTGVLKKILLTVLCVSSC